MKKLALLLLAITLALGACQQPEAAKPNDGRSGVPVWSSLMAYSWDGALLEDIRKEQDFGDIWWINDEAVAKLYGEEVFPDGGCTDGIFHFAFSSRQDVGELAEASGFTREELANWTDAWDWATWEYLSRSWEMSVTCQPLTGDWFTPSWWIPPEDWTFEDMLNRASWDREELLEKYRSGELGPSNPQPTSQYAMPAFVPVEGHKGYEMAVVHAAPDGRPLQVRLRWKNEEGFGFWAELPGYALDAFWEYSWFIKVNV